MKTIIAGSRGLSLEDTQAAVAACPWCISAVVGGGAKGPDKHGEQFAHATGLPFELYEANWQRDGDQAGFIRNLYMAEVGGALLAVWDGESNGTRHMIETMESRGKPVYVHMVEPTREEKRRAPDRPTMDFETYSEAGYYVDFATGKVKGVGSQGKGGLPEVGTPAYAEHPTAEVLCLYYDLLDGKGRRGWRPGEPYPADLLNHIANGGDIAAWNIGFERYIWHYVCVPRFGWPVIPLENCYCDMAKSRRFSTPGSLDMAAKVIGGVPKDKKGKDLIRKLTRPHTPTKKRPAFRWTRETAPEDFHALDSYCDTDVESEMTTSSFIPDLTDYERRTWINDQMINERGVQVDVESLDACLDILRQATDRFTQELRQITGGAVSTVNATQQFTEWLATQGVRTPSIDADHVKELLKRDNLPPVARRALEIRQSLGSANVKKLPKLKLQINNDGRLRDQYSYCGADRTGRWSAGGVQLQNITAKGPKSKQCAQCGHIVGKDYSLQPMGAPEACPECLGFEWQDCPEWTVEAVEYALNVIRRRNLDELIGTWGDPIAVLCGCLRGLFTAPEGKRLVCCDFSAIEAVVLACLSRCQWRIDVFNTHGKIYEMSASKISGVPFEEFAVYKEANGMHHPLRKSLGKVAELACFTRDTQVLTKRGYVPIVEVKPTDQLWDGVEWVTSDGVVHKGKRGVITLDGVGVTPEHPVSLNGSWKEARLLASNKNTLRQALETGSANLPSCATNFGANAGGLSVLALAVRSALSTCLTSTAGSLRGAAHAVARKAATLTSRDTLNTPKSCQTPSIAVGCVTASPPQSAGVTIPRAGGTQTTAVGESRFAKNGASLKDRFSSTFRPLPDGTTPPSKWTGSTPTGTTSRATSVLLPKQKTAETRGQSSHCKSGSTNLRDVYDIVNAGPRHRFTIKTDSGHLLVHNSGYGGWVGAWNAFGAEEHFANEQEIKDAIIGWREASPEIVEFWGGQHKQIGEKPWDSTPHLFGLEGAFVAAMQNPGEPHWVGDIAFMLDTDMDCMLCRLPSGRLLHYHRPRLDPSEDHFRRPCYSITFEGYNSNSQKGRVGWQRMETYGGRLAENVTQAVSADIQAEAMCRVQDGGFPVVMHTHDELTAEMPEWDDTALDRMTEIMIQRPSWAPWWPIRGAGWMHKRYQKD